MIGMIRDSWWWPWWASSLIDLGVVVCALIVLRFGRRRRTRALAAGLVVAGLVAAVLAPIVMTESDHRMNDSPSMRSGAG